MKTGSKHLAPDLKLCLKGQSQLMLPGQSPACPLATALHRTLEKRSKHCYRLCSLLYLLPAPHFWGLEMEESTHSGIVPVELGHIWDTHEDPLSWKCSWGFCRLARDMCALQWSYAFLPRSWYYRISLSKDKLIHIQFHKKMQKKKNTAIYILF